MLRRDLPYIFPAYLSRAIAVPPEIMISWERSDVAWCLKDTEKNLIYINEKYRYLDIFGIDNEDATFPDLQKDIFYHEEKVIIEKRKVEAIGIFPETKESQFTIYNLPL